MSLLSLLLRPAAHERRLVSEVLVDYFLLGGGGAAVAVTGSRAFASGVPVVASVGTAPSIGGNTSEINDTKLDDITAAGSSLATVREAFIWVYGAGLSAVNGLYVASGTFNGRTAYANSQTGTDILWRGADWYLSAGGFGDAYEFGSGTTPGDAELLYPNGLPPLGEPLYPPAPGVIFVPRQSDPDLNSGLIVLTYPSSVPPLTVSGGLTYTETAVGSNRRYEFTAGSGTITFP
jgi:hypothetical protein